jgi:Bacterial proteasome activator
MEESEIISRQPKDEVAPPGRFVVSVGEPADVGSACRIEEPDRLLRIWSMLQAICEQLDSATLPPEGIPGLQRQLRAIRRELDRAVSPPLAAELRRILPAHETAPSAGALRIECAVLLSWVGSLVVQMLTSFGAAYERLEHPQAPDSAARGAGPGHGRVEVAG